MHRGGLFALALASVLPSPALAQDKSEVYTSASAMESVQPNVATLTVEFSATRATPMAAGRANAERANSIREALVALGVPNDSIVTRGYSSALRVGNYDKDTVFVTTNTMVARIRDFTLLGPAIDTVLAEGATRVSGVSFSADNIETVEARVLGAATKAVRDRAVVMASAIGYQLGDLLELTTEAPASYGPGLSLSEIVVTVAPAASNTTIQAPLVQVRGVVYARWAASRR